jgi:hypothetical protein
MSAGQHICCVLPKELLAFRKGWQGSVEPQTAESAYPLKASPNGIPPAKQPNLGRAEQPILWGKSRARLRYQLLAGLRSCALHVSRLLRIK